MSQGMQRSAQLIAECSLSVKTSYLLAESGNVIDRFNAIMSVLEKGVGTKEGGERAAAR